MQEQGQLLQEQGQLLQQQGVLSHETEAVGVHSEHHCEGRTLSSSILNETSAPMASAANKQSAQTVMEAVNAEADTAEAVEVLEESEEEHAGQFIMNPLAQW